MAILYHQEEEVGPPIQCHIISLPCKFLEEVRLLLQHCLLPPGRFLGRGHTPCLVMGPPLSQEFQQEFEAGYQNMPLPLAFKAGPFPFRQDLVKSAISTTVSIANGHLSVWPPLEWSTLINYDPDTDTSFFYILNFLLLSNFIIL